MAALFAPFLLAGDLPIIVDLYFVGLRIDSLDTPSRYTSGLTVNASPVSTGHIIIRGFFRGLRCYLEYSRGGGHLNTLFTS